MRLLTIIGAVLLLLMPYVSMAEAIEIKFSHVVSENTPKGQMALRFKELIEQRLPEKIKVSIYPNSTLVGDAKVLEAILNGQVQMAAPSLSLFRSYTKKLQVYDLPFLFKDIRDVENFQNSLDGQYILIELQDKGLVGLGYLHNGMKQLSANSPLHVPQDATGKRFRIMKSKVLESQFKELKAYPLVLPFSKVFSALFANEIDGQENTWSNIYSKNLYKVQPYITESNHGVLDYMVVTSKDFWVNLDGNSQIEIKKALGEAIVYGNLIASQKSKTDRQAIIDSGKSEIISLSTDQREAWVKAMKPVWKEFEAEIGVELIRAAVSYSK